MRMFSRNLILAVCLLSAAGTAFAAVTVTSASALTSNNVRTAESSLGDLVADAVRASQQNVDVAFISASELKEVEIPKGKISSSDIVDAISYPDDPIVIVRLSGDQIKQALEKSVSIYDQKNLGFLQVSGLKFAFKKTGSDRVTSVTIKNDPIESGKDYKVAMTNSLANGALGYWRIWSKDQVVTVSKTTVPNAVEEFLKGKTSIDYGTLNRITVNK